MYVITFGCLSLLAEIYSNMHLFEFTAEERMTQTTLPLTRILLGLLTARHSTITDLTALG